MKEKVILETVIESIKEVLEEFNEPTHDIKNDTVISGDGGILDSLGLVSLIVKLEEIIFTGQGKDIQIVDEDVLLATIENN